MARTAAPNEYERRRSLLDTRIVKPVILHLPKAHPRQYEFLSMLDRPDVRFAVGACGTKFGKTFGTTAKIVERAWNKKDSLNWWVSPIYKQAEMAFDMVKRMLPDGSFKPYAADLIIQLLQPNGAEHSVIEFKSADNPDSLRGFGVHFFVMDEAARCPYESWVSLYTTVTQTMGVGYIISTPKGRNWFYDVYQWGVKEYEDGTPMFTKGEDPHPEFISIRMPTWTNPHVRLEAVESFKRSMPDDIFRQEIGAQFLLDSAGVFRGVSQCVKPGELQEPHPSVNYVMGVDLARINDYTVLIVMDRTSRHVVHFERFNQISWELQYRRIIDVAKRYRAIVCMDSTGVGDPIVQTIQTAGINVIPYTIGGSARKQQLIDKLRVNVEKQRVSFPLILPLKRELENYEYQTTPSGAVKFSAPPGQHDDCVISLALANWIADQSEYKYTFSQVRGI